MSLYRHIVVGTDFSNQAEAAVALALKLALQQSARLSLLHIIDERVMQYQEVLPLSPSEMEEMLTQEARRKLLKLVNTQDAENLSLEAHVIFGKPDAELQRYCQENNAELAVVGQRGRHLIRQLLLGSTAERLLRHAILPTLVVHPEATSTWNTILAPVDFSDASRAALDQAIHFAKEFNAALHILHVTEETPFASLSGLLPLNEAEGMRNSYEAKVMDEYKAFLASVDFDNVPYTQHFRRGAASMEIRLWAEELKADLIVMGSVGRTGVRGMLIGNTAERVARALPCSLLTVKPPSA